MQADPFLLNAAKPMGADGKAILLRMNNSHAQLADWGFSHVELAADAHVLDIGCGGGANLAWLLKQCPQGRACGVDYSEVSVDLSSATNAEAIASGRCRVLHGDVADLPFADASFDFACAFETLYFWPTPVSGLAEIRRTLRPGATLLICHEADGSRPGDELWPEKIPGMRVYNEEQLTELLEAAGYTGIRVSHGPQQGWICATAKA